MPLDGSKIKLSIIVPFKRKQSPESSNLIRMDFDRFNDKNMDPPKISNSCHQHDINFHYLRGEGMNQITFV